MSDEQAAAGPVHWPTLTAEEVEEGWIDLLAWVHALKARYPNGVRIPDCWWQHTDLVEALSALRDHERQCFGRSSPAVAAVEWQRARRDIEQMIDVWIKRLPCAVPGRGHQPTYVLSEVPDGWHEHVDADVESRRARPLD